MDATNQTIAFGNLETARTVFNQLQDLANNDLPLMLRYLVALDSKAVDKNSHAASLDYLTGDVTENTIVLDNYHSSRKKHENAICGFFLTQVDATGGNEGGGDYVERVFEIADVDGISYGFVRQTGFYTSEYGTEWDYEITRVYPKQVVVTQYFESP